MVVRRRAERLMWCAVTPVFLLTTRSNYDLLATEKRSKFSFEPFCQLLNESRGFNLMKMTSQVRLKVAGGVVWKVEVWSAGVPSMIWPPFLSAWVKSFSIVAIVRRLSAL